MANPNKMNFALKMFTLKCMNYEATSQFNRRLLKFRTFPLWVIVVADFVTAAVVVIAGLVSTFDPELTGVDIVAATAGGSTGPWGLLGGSWDLAPYSIYY